MIKLHEISLKNKYEELYKVNISDETILSEAKRCNLKYVKNRRKNGIMGVFVGIKRKKHEVVIEDDEDSD